MRLFELQDNNKEANKLRSKGLLEGWKKTKEMLHYQGLQYVLKVIYSELINRHHDDSLAGYFDIEKTQDLIAKEYYWPMLQKEVEAYVKSCDVYLVLKAVCHKPYNDL